MHTCVYVCVYTNTPDRSAGESQLRNRDGYVTYEIINSQIFVHAKYFFKKNENKKEIEKGDEGNVCVYENVCWGRGVKVRKRE